MSLDQTHYDVAIISTGLPQSILSAALSAAGRSVIHLDENDYYADQWASLTLSELQRWCKREGKKRAVELSFPAASSVNDIPPDMLAQDRHYAISLAPTLIPATGPSIDTLIASGVSSYATFRLLEQTAVYVPDGSGSSRLQAVPSSKEDIFKSKEISLVDKRKLMKLLQYIASDDWGLDDSTAQRPFVEYLADEHKLSSALINSVAYGVCLCSSSAESTHEAMLRARSHLRSTGRYGNSAYLVGQYGGAGELAQSYCRASAVKGGTFILNHGIESVRKEDTAWSIDVTDIKERITASYLVSDEQLLSKFSIGPQTQFGPAQGATHRGVLVLDRPIDFCTHVRDSSHSTLETGLIVFPPRSIAENVNTVLVLMMGEGTFSCPKGQYVYYIQTEEADDSRPASAVLQPVIDEILRLLPRSEQVPACQPLLKLTYREVNTVVPAATHPELKLASVSFPPANPSMVSMTDTAVQVAEDLYYSILASRSPASEGKYDETLSKIKKAALDKSSRRRKRSDADYQGRGGRGSDDGVTKDLDDQEAARSLSSGWSSHGILDFFGTSPE